MPQEPSAYRMGLARENLFRGLETLWAPPTVLDRHYKHGLLIGSDMALATQFRLQHTILLYSAYHLKYPCFGSRGGGVQNWVLRRASK